MNKFFKILSLVLFVIVVGMPLYLIALVLLFPLYPLLILLMFVPGIENTLKYIQKDDGIIKIKQEMK